MERKPARPQVFQLDDTERLVRPGGPALVDAEGRRHDVPPKVFDVLRFVEEILATGQAVKITPVRTELPIDEAADAVDMPRDELRSYAAEGRLPFRSSQYHDWVQLGDVIALKAQLKIQTREALDELLSEDLWEDGTEPGSPPTPKP